MDNVLKPSVGVLGSTSVKSVIDGLLALRPMVAMRDAVFFSFDETDRHFVRGLESRARESTYASLGFLVAPAPFRWAGGSAETRRRIAATAVLGTDRTIVLIGARTHENPWIDAEVEATLAAGNPVFAIRLPDTAAPTPEVLLRHGVMVHPWSEENLRALVAG